MSATVKIIEDIKDVNAPQMTQTEKSLMRYFGLQLSDLPFDKLELGQSFKITSDTNSYFSVNTITSASRINSRITGKKFKCVLSPPGNHSSIECTRIK